MGAWGFDAFSNDTALDWIYDLEEATDGIGFLRATLSVTDDGYLEAPEACCALAASEVVAAAGGRPLVDSTVSATPLGGIVPEQVTAWVSTHGPSVSQADRALARRAIDRVVGPDSELAELWEDDLDDWLVTVDDLRSRLT